MNPVSKLILGGHSFIGQLGNDPMADFDMQTAIVSACLDSGITTFDTTYQPERMALGKIMERLGRRNEAHIIAWNFFIDFGPGENVGGPESYKPHHIYALLEQLQTNHIDSLVVHGVNDPNEDARQFKLTTQWLNQGLIGRIGIWAPSLGNIDLLKNIPSLTFMVRPYNVLTDEAPPIFTAAKNAGLETIACSPFVRGWQLDKMAQASGGIMHKQRIADAMLRYSLHSPSVDRLIVSMRSSELVRMNIESANQGPLTEDARLELIRLTRKAR
ncbi:MAG: hypothetical protein EHM64_16895 [Ignavibacteriae bacterium]|nr:MAG: hypothetical protein EHM64_16895 [Ignavibacteriota bacterium]